jgi:hypothetical protein
MSKQHLAPSEFLALFGEKLKEYTKHLFIAVNQTHQEHLLKQKFLLLPKSISPIIVDMDFAENHEIVHKVEVQSEHWGHQQVTLYIVITHHRVEQASGTFEAVSEAHVFVSSDRTHDTYFVQHALTELKTHFAARGMKFNHWFINTDGAASHFKNRSRTAQETLLLLSLLLVLLYYYYCC